MPPLLPTILLLPPFPPVFDTPLFRADAPACLAATTARSRYPVQPVLLYITDANILACAALRRWRDAGRCEHSPTATAFFTTVSAHTD